VHGSRWSSQLCPRRPPLYRRPGADLFHRLSRFKVFPHSLSTGTSGGDFGQRVGGGCRMSVMHLTTLASLLLKRILRCSERVHSTFASSSGSSPTAVLMMCSHNERRLPFS
jgi:hypothetical protein